jgi:DNA-binding CsgD family transcriptional regulator
LPGAIKAPECSARLSSREQCILRCLAEGDSNKVIARKTNISADTVKVHVKAILRKVRVGNRTQAAVWALNNISATETSDKVWHLPTRHSLVASRKGVSAGRPSSSPQVHSICLRTLIPNFGLFALQHFSTCLGE